MSDTLYADVSEFQAAVNDQYPYHFIAFRSSDGTYLDHHFQSNLAWAKAATEAGRLAGFIVYFVWENNPATDLAALMHAVGVPHWGMAVMIDVESWANRYSGDHSASINAEAAKVAAWLGSTKRVIGYGNAGDLAGLWPGRGAISIVLANYAANPPFPHKIAHQYADNYPVPPFGPCDINSADGFTAAAFALMLGIARPAPPEPPTPPGPHRPTSNVLRPGQQLVRGEMLQSGDGMHSLHMQGDGNLVLYSGSKPVWTTRTAGEGDRLAMQGDGNLVLYAAGGRPLWNTRTNGNPGAYLVLQNDGNLVLYAADGRPLWNTHTNGK